MNLLGSPYITLKADNIKLFFPEPSLYITVAGAVFSVFVAVCFEVLTAAWASSRIESWVLFIPCPRMLVPPFPSAFIRAEFLFSAFARRLLDWDSAKRTGLTIKQKDVVGKPGKSIHLAVITDSVYRYAKFGCDSSISDTFCPHGNDLIFNLASHDQPPWRGIPLPRFSPQ